MSQIFTFCIFGFVFKRTLIGNTSHNAQDKNKNKYHKDGYEYDVQLGYVDETQVDGMGIVIVGRV